MEGKPDLVIGNYTDGNLVASLMARKLGITQVAITLFKFSFQLFLWLQVYVFFRYVYWFHSLIENQGTIAHALEKTKYEDSDVKWKELDPKYHFSCQFMADTVAMNASDFIITSTYQEIAGRFAQIALHTC